MQKAGKRTSYSARVRKLKRHTNGKNFTITSHRDVINSVNMQKYEFQKIPFPESKKEQADLAIKLVKFGVTLKSYASSLDKKEIIGYVIA